MLPFTIVFDGGITLGIWKPKRIMQEVFDVDVSHDNVDVFCGDRNPFFVSRFFVLRGVLVLFPCASKWCRVLARRLFHDPSDHDDPRFLPPASSLILLEGYWLLAVE